MKKFYALFIMMFVFLVAGNAQTYFQNFDTLTAGVLTAQTLGSPWTTWSSAPGGAEDALISNAQSSSSPNSIGVLADDDLVYTFNDLTTGRYKVSFKMFVDNAKIGYYNFLSDFASSSSLWALQVFIYDDTITVDAGGTAAVRQPITLGIWHQIDVIIDLDDDFATFLLDDAEVISYQWSKGAQGTDNTLKLDGIDFYGLNGADCPTTTTSTAGYFVDDMSVEIVTAPEAPFNLSATLTGGTVDVSWTQPTNVPDLYKLTRNGSVIYAGANIGYADVNPWPNDYGYGARAFYAGEGYSHNSNIDTVNVPNGVSRNLVLMEEGTGTWCTFCPGAAMGLRDLIETNQKEAVAIAYHSGDTYENTDALTRIGYYSISGFPTVVADGKLTAVGGSATVSQYSTYLPMYNTRYTTPSLHTLDVSVVENSTDNYTATITAEQTFEYASGWKLHAALTESNIAETWGNQTEVDAVLRAMYPDASGTVADFSSQPTQVFTINFSTTGFVKNNCEFIVFLQHNATKEVTQTAKVDMSSVLGIAELENKQISLYPNPAQDYVVLNSSGNGIVEMTDMTGKTVYTSAITDATELIDLRNFSKGIYMVKYTTDGNVLSKKIVIQ